MKFAISVLTYSAVALSKRCIESVLKHSADFELILTANGNVDAANHFSDVAKANPNVRVVVNEKNEGFIAPNRKVFDMAVESGAEYLILLNDDTTVPAGWLEKLEAPFKQFPTAALVGPEGGGCHILPNFHGTMGPFEYLEGSCLCMKVDVIRKMGLFPEQLAGAYGEDSCLSLRVREAGYSIHRVPLPISHVRGATSSMVPQAMKWQEANHVWLKKRFAHYLKVRHFEHPILVRRADAWGDVLLTTPIIRALRKWRPLSPIHVDTNCVEVFRDNPHVAKAGRGIPVPKDALVIDLNGSYEGMKETGILEAYSQTALTALGGEFAVDDKTLDFYCRPADVPKFGYSPGGKVVAVHAGPVTWRSKEWGADRFNAVTKEMMSNGWTVILVGSTRTAPIACTTDTRGRTTIHQLGAILGACNLFVGLDSFPLHLAQAMGTPSVGIFGICYSRFILTASNAIGVDSDAPSAGMRHRVLNSREVDDSGAAIAAITPAMVMETVRRTGVYDPRNRPVSTPL